MLWKMGILLLPVGVGAFLLESEDDLLVLFGIEEEVVGYPEEKGLGFFVGHFVAFPPKAEKRFLHQILGLVAAGAFVTKKIPDMPGMGEEQLLVDWFLTNGMLYWRIHFEGANVWKLDDWAQSFFGSDNLPGPTIAGCWWFFFVLSILHPPPTAPKSLRVDLSVNRQNLYFQLRFGCENS